MIHIMLITKHYLKKYVKRLLKMVKQKNLNLQIYFKTYQRKEKEKLNQLVVLK